MFPDYVLGDMVARYEQNDSTLALTLIPLSRTEAVVPQRSHLEEREVLAMPFGVPPARHFHSLVQVQCTRDDRPNGYAQGRTLCNGGTTQALRLVSHEEKTRADGMREIVTVLETAYGLRCSHRLCWQPGDPALRVQTTVENCGSEPLTLELLSSFSLDGITPFHRADAPGRLVLHRFRSSWSAEGRADSQPIETLHLEPGWQGHSVNVERFGQVGTMPVRGFFPMVAVEDVEAGVTWGAQLGWAGSWQMEAYRKGDCLALSGGLADREFGHWLKTLQPGEQLEAPPAWLTVCAGDRDEACARLVAQQERVLPPVPTIEEVLAPIFNEFCSSWGDPDEERLLALAERLAETPVRYLVIDAGWYADKNTSWFSTHGDWVPGSGRFPQGLAATATAIRERGLIPGLWFEWETCGHDSACFQDTEKLLKRDDHPVTVGGRRFLDLRQPPVRTYLEERVLRRLRDDGFGYVKFDYNETLGIGADGAESQGEGLRQVILATEQLYAGLAESFPGGVVELCSSGGHRLESSLLSHAHMGSFSDAHETPELPIIAAALHRLIPVRQSQIWAVLRPEADERRLIYVLAAGFLGRLCLSGDVAALSQEQWNLTRRALDLYTEITSILRDGRTYFFGPQIKVWRHPEGWQVIVRVASDRKSALVVAHAFGGELPSTVTIPLPRGPWREDKTLTEPGNDLRVSEERLNWQIPGAFSAAVALLRR
jgi:alpha-galactosidase